ncbi:MAG: carbon-nitrogen hydrolase family protein [Oscillospiraceae bacterium]|nr:carbon-nitrogen hydrolase family protein [Oscillospiraceae bacterium]
MENLRKYKIAVVQMDSRNDKGANLRAACARIDEAAAAGAKLVSFPEVMNLSGENIGEGGGHEPIPGYTTEKLMAKAREHGIYIHSGSFAEEIPGETRAYNTSVIIDPNGEIIATYRKLHTFDVTLPDGSVQDESARIRPGDEIVTVDTALGKMGMSICYDIRFGEMYRLMALEGAQVIFTPASFTMATGKDHWEPILRTRAIENGCYIVAADQFGQKARFPAFGNSMVIDPWGTIIARGGERADLIYAEIDLDYLDAVRARIPSLKNRRSDVYDVVRKDKKP